jgi:hypothetical protein
MAMPPRCYVTAVAKMPKRAGYGALEDRRTYAYVQPRSKMSLLTMLDYQRILVTRKILRRKITRFKLVTGRLAYRDLLATLEKCRICGFGVEAKPRSIVVCCADKLRPLINALYSARLLVQSPMHSAC